MGRSLAKLLPQSNFALTGAVLGGVVFGFGMALVGTCGFGALVRIGGGSLRSAVVFGIAALTAQRGLLTPLRVQIVDDLAFDFSAAGDQSLANLLSHATGTELGIVVAPAVAIGLLASIFAAPRYRWDLSNIVTGILIGLGVAFGWVATTWASAHAFAPIQIEATSFVVPVGDTLLKLVTYTETLPDYGVGLVVGTLLGATVAAWRKKDARWEAPRAKPSLSGCSPDGRRRRLRDGLYDRTGHLGRLHAGNLGPHRLHFHRRWRTVRSCLADRRLGPFAHPRPRSSSSGRIEDREIFSGRGEPVRRARTLNRTDARIGQMKTYDRRLVRCEPVDQGGTCGRSLCAVLIRPDFPIRLFKGNHRMVDRIPGHQNRVRPPVQHEGDVGRRMSMRIDRFDAGYGLVAGIEESDQVLDRIKPVAGTDNERFPFLRHAIQRIVGTPEIPFGLRDPRVGIRIKRIAEIIEHTPDAIGMGMGEDDVGDLGRIDAGSLETVGQSAHRRLKIGSRSRIEENEAVALPQQGQVACGLGSIER